MSKIKYQQIGRIFWLIVFGSMSSLMFLYFILEDPDRFPVALPPLLIYLTLEILQKRGLIKRKAKYIPHTLGEHLLINTIMVGWYLWMLLVVEGYVMIKITFLIVLTAVGFFTTAGYFNYQSQFTNNA